MKTEGHLYFEMMVHFIEIMLVLGIAGTLVWLKKAKKDQGGRGRKKGLK